MNNNDPRTSPATAPVRDNALARIEATRAMKFDMTGITPDRSRNQLRGGTINRKRRALR